MAKQEPEYLLKVTIDVLYRASQERITSFFLGEFDTIRKAEKLRDNLTRFNPDKLFLAKYEQITNPQFKIIPNEIDK
ncbi:hypothetical protein K0H38_26135 [Bacteroides xylanisolvens]|jgi:hypothetical protein|uniref:hypothetical protein n=1 Tax=Bacteroides xylanisolvens TaxID=371601 RepID=UPI001F27D91C|nr:hypothetical protein [Bacteroides xylanisolvens]MCE9419058.1 hypothetical protein [Bacteroides xylanisolvens]MCE9455110.1 hypothetical protein [Bacteroides xylanisolvens]